jgi:hypothetical protein
MTWQRNVLIVSIITFVGGTYISYRHLLSNYQKAKLEESEARRELAEKKRLKVERTMRNFEIGVGVTGLVGLAFTWSYFKFWRKPSKI